MSPRKLIVAFCIAGTTAGAAGAAMAASSPPPKKATIKVSQKLVIKPNRYIQNGLRWDKDTYSVKSGGTLHVVNTAADEGPHTFTVVAEKDLPKTAAQAFKCKPCDVLNKAHGIDPNSNAPPKFAFLENGTGQDAPPKVDRPGDSGITGQGKKGEFIDLPVTAKKGTTLYFICLLHPWMEAKVNVG